MMIPDVVLERHEQEVAKLRITIEDLQKDNSLLKNQVAMQKWKIETLEAQIAAEHYDDKCWGISEY